jgi:hypothetical protein
MSILGISHLAQYSSKAYNRIEFINSYGTSILMTVILLISGIFISSLAYGLFLIVGVSIGEFYYKYFVVYGSVATLIIGWHLSINMGEQISKILPAISKIMSVLVLVVLFIFTFVLIVNYLGELKTLIDDKGTLIMINLTLLTVLALLLFIISSRKDNKKELFVDYVNFLLVILSIIINTLIVISCLVWIFEKGLTPFRISATVLNLIIYSNLIGVAFLYYKYFRNKIDYSKIKIFMGTFLLVYAIWSIIVVFLFPLIY